MRIVSWNVNGIRAAVRKGLCQKITEFGADMIGLQEIKAKPDQVEEACADITDYHRFINSAERPGYSGVALFTKKKPLRIMTSLDEDRFDKEGRMIAAFFEGLLVVNVYFPNGAGKDGDNSRVPYKLDFYDALFDRLEEHDIPKLIMGDFNTAPHEIDLARPKENQNTSGFLPEEREHFQRILSRGYIDTFRHFNKSPDNYTWWNMWRKSRERNVGWRIDGVLASKDAMPFIKSAFIWPEVMGSDHCPVGVDLDWS